MTKETKTTENNRLEIDKLSADILMNALTEIKKSIAEIKESQNPDKEKLITIDEVCELLSISKPTIFNWTKQGILKRYKKGNRTYFKKNEVLSIA